MKSTRKEGVAGRRGRRALVLLALALFLSACDGREAGGGADGPPVTRSDSAGVEIVRSAGPVWSDGEGWEISPTPILEIGTDAGDEAYQLHRVMGATMLPDGRLAVANSGSHELRLYGPDGSHRASIGGDGDGPGEFRFLARLWQLPGDSLGAFDNSLRRISVFDLEGGLSRTFSLETADAPGGRPLPWLAFGDGTLATAAGTARLVPGEEEGLIEGDRILIARFAPDGTRIGTLAEGRTGRRWGTGHAGGLFPSLPFELISPPWTVGPDAVHVGSWREHEVRTTDLEGRLVRVVRWEGTARPVTDELLQRFEDHRTAAMPDPEERTRFRQWLREIHVPSTLPVFDELRVDSEGHLWVREYRVPWEGEAAADWWIFDPSGEWLGSIRTPPAFEIEEIGEDHIVGIRRDEMGVEYVTVLGLDRSD